MGRAAGFIGVLLAAAIGFYLYTRQAETAAQGTANPRTTIDVAGVRNDLIALANAERRYYATEGKYASIDELRAHGDISMPSNSRGPFTYSAKVGESSFRITATYTGLPGPDAPKGLSIDETMQITSSP
jgi:hypothetical protein